MIELLQTGAPVARNWRTINDIGRALNAGMLPEQQDRSAIAGLRQRPRDFRYAPFQLYQSGTWLQWKVTTGWFKPAGPTIVPTDVETQFTLTSGEAEYWFWLEVTNTTAVVTASATEPTWTINQVLIGWVDTDTDSASSIATPYQFLLTNVQIPCL